ncbi:MAG: TolC family protein [Nitrospiraceae bacterium]|nr:TolC family protein [Nitrospiraceae bacterium]
MRSGLALKKTIALLWASIAVISMAAAFTGWAQPVKAGETLTLDKAINMALAYNPDILAAMDTNRAARSLIGQAKSSYYPQVNLTAAQQEYSITNRNVTSTAASGGQATSGRLALSGFTTAASVSQNIYDFGKTASQVKAQKFNYISSGQDLENIKENVVLQVEQAYYNVLQAQRNIGIANMVVGQFEQHLKQASAFHEAGTKPKYDVTLAQVNLSNAKLNLIVVDNNAAVSKADLNNIMGIPGATPYTVEDNLSFQKYNVSFDEALKKAYANRPDLKALIFREKSAEENIAFVKTGYYPDISGTASYGYTGDRLPLNSYWTAGASVSFPIFSGFVTKYQLIQARENLNTLSANETSLRHAIFLEVQTYYLNLGEAQQRVGAAKLVVDQAKENLDVATGMYKYGVGNALDVTDALISYSSAQTSYVSALYDYKIAQANIEKAMGLYGGGQK